MVLLNALQSSPFLRIGLWPALWVGAAGSACACVHGRGPAYIRRASL